MFQGISVAVFPFAGFFAVTFFVLHKRLLANEGKKFGCLNKKTGGSFRVTHSCSQHIQIAFLALTSPHVLIGAESL